jgi:hypothetical protein
VGVKRGENTVDFSLLGLRRLTVQRRGYRKRNDESSHGEV